MPRTIEIKLYSFNELSDKAKEKAREWFREGNLQHDWWDTTYEDAESIANLMGIEFATKGKQQGPDIQFSGFWSQGDGASYTGTYTVRPNVLDAVKGYAALDKELHRIAAEFDRINTLYPTLTATITRSNSMNYVHECMMDSDAFYTKPAESEDEDPEEINLPTDEDKNLRDNFRAFAKWIYRSLEREHDYQQSDETVDSNIEANEYEFNEDGTRSRHG